MSRNSTWNKFIIQKAGLTNPSFFMALIFILINNIFFLFSSFRSWNVIVLIWHNKNTQYNANESLEFNQQFILRENEIALVFFYFTHIISFLGILSYLPSAVIWKCLFWFNLNLHLDLSTYIENMLKSLVNIN